MAWKEQEKQEEDEEWRDKERTKFPKIHFATTPLESCEYPETDSFTSAISCWGLAYNSLIYHSYYFLIYKQFNFSFKNKFKNINKR